MLPKELKYAENVLVSMFLKLSSVLPTTMQCLGSLGGVQAFCGKLSGSLSGYTKCSEVFFYKGLGVNLGC